MFIEAVKMIDKNISHWVVQFHFACNLSHASWDSHLLTYFWWDEKHKDVIAFVRNSQLASFLNLMWFSKAYLRDKLNLYFDAVNLFSDAKSLIKEYSYKSAVCTTLDYILLW